MMNRAAILLVVVVMISVASLIMWYKFMIFEESNKKVEFPYKRIVNYDYKVGDVYRPLLPIVDTSGGGWTIVDIVLRARSHTHAQLLNRKLDFSDEVAEIVPTSQNLTAEANVMIYNRVPKCGSSLFRNILARLAQRNGFRFQSHWNYHQHVLSDIEIENMAQNFRNITREKRLAYEGHFYFTDWRRNGVKAVLFNMVRDPISRLVSWFYFLRRDDKWENSKEKPSTEWFEKDFDTCVLRADPECQFGGSHELQLTYFCGREWECGSKYSRKALQKAKANIETGYSVVGVLENLNESLHVLEKYIPDYFNGITREVDLSRRLNETPHPDPSNKTLAILRKELWAEYELYEFIKQRLALQLQHINQQNE